MLASAWARCLAFLQALEAYERYKRPKGKRGLKTRLDNLVNALPRPVKKLVPTDFTEVATDTRDYFSHRIPQLHAKAARDERLFALTRGLKLLFELTLLRELGFTQTEIAKATLDQNQRLVRDVERSFLVF